MLRDLFMKKYTSRWSNIILPTILLFQLMLGFNLNSLPALTHKNSLPNKELILALDYLQQEVISYTLDSLPPKKHTDHPFGLGATTQCLLIALEQDDIPILASKSLIHNILKHKAIFIDFSKLNTNKLRKKYRKYNRFSDFTAFKEFQNLCKYYYQKYKAISSCIENGLSAEEINKLAEFSSDKAPRYVRSEQSNEMNLYLMAARINLEKKWILKEVDQNLLLLFPKKLVKKSTPKIKPGTITIFEKQVGLKIHHLKTVKVKEILNFKLSTIKATNSFLNALENLFVKKNEYRVQKNAPIWSFYITGHGVSAINDKIILQQLEALRNHYSNLVKNKKFSQCFKNVHYNNKNHMAKCKNHRRFMKHFNELESIKYEIKKIQHQKASLDFKNNGLIASLEKDIFQKVLMFFNNSINTGFLFYSSCFAGGENLVDPYQKNKQPLILNYPVISSTLAENMSFQDTPELCLPPYTISKLTQADIDKAQHRLNFRTTLQYKKFFNALKKGEHKNESNLVNIISYLRPHELTQDATSFFYDLRNIPSYRAANSKLFKVLPGEPSITIFDHGNCKNKRLTNLKVGTQANLFYTSYIPYRMILQNKFNNTLAFVSMIPGFAAHTIEEIDATQYTLMELLNSFLVFAELKAPKIFWIKKLVVKNSQIFNSTTFNAGLKETLILHDVIILRNIFTSDCLASINKDALAEGQNCIFFTKYPSGKSYQVKWSGHVLSPENCKIIKVSSKNYARELIAFKPEILDHTFKTLKNIFTLPVSLLA